MSIMKRCYLNQTNLDNLNNPVCSETYIGETRRNILKLDGTNMKILRKNQNQPNTSKSNLAIHFSGKFYFLPQLVITEKVWKCQL